MTMPCHQTKNGGNFFINALYSNGRKLFKKKIQNSQPEYKSKVYTVFLKRAKNLYINVNQNKIAPSPHNKIN